MTGNPVRTEIGTLGRVAASNQSPENQKSDYLCRFMSRYFIELAFDGTAYHGWQVQKNAHSVQEELNLALSTLLYPGTLAKVDTIGCGRTDTGVHARQFFAHFDCPEKPDVTRLQHRLNKILPPDVGVFRVFSVPSDLHARFSAISRTYRYFIMQQKDPYYLNKAWYNYHQLDIDTMNTAAGCLKEYQDFSSFSKSGTQVKTNICHILQAEWTRKQGLLVFTIKADRFLRNMVRAIVGTLAEVGMGRKSCEDFRKVIESKSRSSAGLSVPACGLFLTEVDYPGLKLKV